MSLNDIITAILVISLITAAASAIQAKMQGQDWQEGALAGFVAGFFASCAFAILAHFGVKVSIP